MVWSTYLCACECEYMCLYKPWQTQHKTVCVEKSKTIQNTICVYNSVYNHAGNHILRLTHAVDMVWSTYSCACECECMWLYKPLRHTTKKQCVSKPPKQFKKKFHIQYGVQSCRRLYFMIVACRRYGLEYVFMRIWLGICVLTQHVPKLAQNVPKPTKHLQKEERTRNLWL